MKHTKVEMEELYHSYKTGWITGADVRILVDPHTIAGKSPSERSYQEGLTDGQRAFNAAMKEYHRKLTE